MKPSDVKYISKIAEKKIKLTDDLMEILAISQVATLNMRNPQSFDTIEDATLWKDQCNQLLEDIILKTSSLQQYLSDATNAKEKGPKTYAAKRSLTLKLSCRAVTDDDIDHLHVPDNLLTCGTNAQDTTDSDNSNNTPKNSEVTEKLKEEETKDVNENVQLDPDRISKAEEESIKSEGSIFSHVTEKQVNHEELLLLNELDNISEISDLDLSLSDIAVGTESDEFEYRENLPNNKRKRYTKMAPDNRRFKRACRVEVVRFDTNLCSEYIANNPNYRLKDLIIHLKLAKPEAQPSSPSSSDDQMADDNFTIDPLFPAMAVDIDSLPSSPDTVLISPREEDLLLNSEDEMAAAIDAVSDSDMSSAKDSDYEPSVTGKKKKKKAKKQEEAEQDSDYEQEDIVAEAGNSAWKRDPLLNENLDSDSEKKVTKDVEEVKEQEENTPVSTDVEESSSDIKPDLETVNVISIKDASTESDDSDVECIGPISNASPGKGRKNIRALLTDEALQEATQKANKEEQERQKRLKDWKESLSSVLSQSTSELDGLLLDVDDESKKPIVMVNSNLSNRLKRHQQEGVKFMFSACYETVSQISKSPGSGCILAHCMGLGKTFQVTTLVHTLFAYPDTKVKHVVIVCPLSTVPNWNHEFVMTKQLAKCGDDYKVYALSKCTPRRQGLVKVWRKRGGVLILGYDSYYHLLKTTKVRACAPEIEQALRDPGPDLLVCDEGHMLKDQSKKRYKSLQQIRTKRRIILTGTPMQNNLTEYYHMVQFIKPNLLGTFKEFTNRFNNPITNGQYGDSTNADIKVMKQRSHVLHEILKGTVQRYEESELNEYLPQRTDYALYIKMDEIQATLYEDYLNSLKSNTTKRSEFIAHYQQLMPFWMHPCIAFTKENKNQGKKRIEFETVTLENQAETIIDLTPEQQSKFPPDVETNIFYGAKFVIIMAIIEECAKLDDRLLIFSSSLFTLDAIEKFLKIANLNDAFQWIKNETYYRLDGQVPPIGRVDITNKFNDKNSKARIILMTNKVGGLGLNLVSANRVILADISWNPSLDNQSIFRSYRFGQEKPVYIYRLVARGTMEEMVYKRAVTKVAIAGRVVDEQQIDRHYKSVDMQDIYRFVYDKDEVRPIPKVPGDDLLATLLQKYESLIFSYEEHNFLFMNRPDEELNEEEMKEAWVEFNKEKAPKALPVPPIVPTTVPTTVDPLRQVPRFLDNFSPIVRNWASNSQIAAVTTRPPAPNLNITAPNLVTSAASQQVWLTKALLSGGSQSLQPLKSLVHQLANSFTSVQVPNGNQTRFISPFRSEKVNGTERMTFNLLPEVVRAAKASLVSCEPIDLTSNTSDMEVTNVDNEHVDSNDLAANVNPVTAATEAAPRMDGVIPFLPSDGDSTSDHATIEEEVVT